LSTIDLSNNEAEAQLVAAFIKNPEAYWDLNDTGVTHKDFLGNENRRVMKAIEAVVATKKTPDLPNVIEALKAADNESSIAYATRLLSIPVSVAQAKEYSGTVKGLAVARDLAKAGSEIVTIATEERSDAQSAIAKAESVLRKVRANVPQPDRSPDPTDILARLRTSKAEALSTIRFSPTLQDMSGGLQAGHLWVIGGFSSTGKSAVACNLMADVMSERDRWSMLVSTEMTQEKYMLRMLSLLSGVPQTILRSGITTPMVDTDSLKKAETRLARANLRIYDTIYRTSDIRSQATRMKEMEGLDILFVDFIQNVRGDIGDFSYGDVTGTILDLQELAKDLRICVVTFSQISNEMAKYTEDNEFYAFKGSGAIKDAADIAVMLKRNRQTKSPNLDFHVMKNRDGEIGVIQTAIDLPTGRITEQYVEEDDD
jgi:replicative DNA helicase